MEPTQSQSQADSATAGPPSEPEGTKKDPAVLLLIPTLLRNPVVLTTMVAATAASVAWWTGTEVSPLLPDPRIGRGELWRLLTCTLLHVNVIHLLFNLYWLVVLGITVESVLGSRNMLWITVLLALGSSAAEFALLDGGVGLSGVGYGLFALVWVLGRRDPRFRGTLDRRTNWLFAGWFGFCILTTVTGVWAVGNVAHGTGAVLGALLGLTWTVPERYRSPLRVTFGAACLASLLAATWMRPWVNLSPHAGKAQGYLCYRALEGGQNLDAIHWGCEAVALRPGEALYWFYLGIAYHREARLAEAKAAYRRAQELEPDEPKYRFASLEALGPVK